MAVDKSMRILVVDDQETVLEILREILRKLGLRNIETAKDGGKALEMLRGAVDPYGLVLSDWNMKPVSGLQLLQAVRGDPSLAHTPFIMVTGEASKDRVVAAIDAGTTSFIVKPFSLDAVKKRLVAVLGEF
jgi:two-component system chemotaxis response regulator CheY